MDFPALLKPENGLIGAALRGWFDRAATGRATWILILLFLIVGTVFQVVASASVGLDPQSLQVYAWGLHPSPGYDHTPPLCGLIAAGWFSVFPSTDLSFHLLATLNAAIGLYGVDLIARRYLDGDKRLFALLLLLLTPIYPILGDRFAADQTPLSTWPIATYCFLRAVETRGLSWSVRAGATAALALLGSYESVLLVAGFLAAVLVSTERAAYLRSASPWISMVVGAILLAPHVRWLADAGFEPLTGAAALHLDGSLGEVAGRAALKLVGSIVVLTLPVMICWLAMRPDRPTLWGALWPTDGAAAMLAAIWAVSWGLALLLPVRPAPEIAEALFPLQTMAGLFVLPIMLLRPAGIVLSRVAAVRTAALVAVMTLCALIAAPALAWHHHADGTPQGREYYRAVATEITRSWHLSFGLPLKIVVGDVDLANAVTFYAPDHPDSATSFDRDASPWVTPQRLRNEGWAGLCRADDETCLATTKRGAADQDGLILINFQTTNRYLGAAGKPARYVFILVPPQQRGRPG